MWQVVFAHISVESRVVNSNVERFKEHLKAPSPIYEHDNTTGHKTSVENFKIIGREGHGISRTIKEAICIGHKIISKSKRSLHKEYVKANKISSDKLGTW